MKARVVLCAAALLVALVSTTLAPGAPAQSALRINLLGQGHTLSLSSGNAWAYYLTVSRSGRPWQGQVAIQIETLDGKVVAHAAPRRFKGSLLAVYYWDPGNRGQTLAFTVRLLRAGAVVGKVSYPVHVI